MFNILAAFDIALLAGYTVWVLLVAVQVRFRFVSLFNLVQANETLMATHNGVLGSRRYKLVQELCDETDPVQAQRMRDMASSSCADVSPLNVCTAGHLAASRNRQAGWHGRIHQNPGLQDQPHADQHTDHDTRDHWSWLDREECVSLT